MNQENSNYIQNEWRNFLTLPGEEMLIAKRQHWFIMLVPLALALLLSFLSIITSFFLFYVFLSSLPLFISACLILLNAALLFISQTITTWYFHTYIVTNRKILEITYIPLAAFTINGVLLDQVRCTEIDFKIQGILHQLIDIGNIIITFDRPTHQEELVIENIQNCKQIATFLSNALMGSGTPSIARNQSVWFRPKESRKSYLIEDIFQKKNLGRI